MRHHGDGYAAQHSVPKEHAVLALSSLALADLWPDRGASVGILYPVSAPLGDKIANRWAAHHLKEPRMVEENTNIDQVSSHASALSN